MPGPITHIALTDKVFDRLFNGMVRSDFFIGTLFPDIRYLKVIDRSKTHFKEVHLRDIQNEDSFMAGMKFHTLVDQARNQFLLEDNIYSSFKEIKYASYVLKVAEDTLFYKYITDWDTYINYLDRILLAEKDFDIPERALKDWHTLLQRYFQHPPDNKTIKALSMVAGLSNETTIEMNKLLQAVQSDKNIQNTLEDFYQNIENYLDIGKS